MTGILLTTPQIQGPAPSPLLLGTVPGTGAFAAIFAVLAGTPPVEGAPAAPEEGKAIAAPGDGAPAEIAIVPAMPPMLTAAGLPVLPAEASSPPPDAGILPARPEAGGTGQSILLARFSGTSTIASPQEAARPRDAPTAEVALPRPTTSLEGPEMSPTGTGHDIAVDTAVPESSDSVTRTGQKDRLPDLAADRPGEGRPAPALTATMTPRPERTVAPKARPDTVAVSADTKVAPTASPPKEDGAGLSVNPLPDPAAAVLPEPRRGIHDAQPQHRANVHAPPPAERQIVAAVAHTASGRTEILLDPQDLGRVRLSLEGDEAGLVLTVQADRSETADLLRRNADLLREEFRQAGYQNLSFSFGSDGGTPDRPPAPDSDSPTGVAARPAETPAPERPSFGDPGTLNLRL